MTKQKKLTLFAGASVVFALTVVALFLGYQLFMKPVGSDATEVYFDVEPGITLAKISDQLQSKGLIRNSTSFQIYAKFRNLASRIKVGEYALTQAMTPAQILGVLVSGKSVARSITVAEGLNVFDIAEIIEKNKIGTKEEFFKLIYDKDFISSLIDDDVVSLEGYLFPETYKITKFDGVKTLVTQMVRNFNETWKQVQPEIKNVNWSRKNIVIFASIVEKETGLRADRPLVSSVFHNRLKKNMKLQTDPTILYGIALKQGKMPNNITKADLENSDPYNSYVNYGLPPTAISNPGKESLLATIKPSDSNYLFFVSRNDGTTLFSETLEQHNKAVREFQMNAKARENKSWRDAKQ